MGFPGGSEVKNPPAMQWTQEMRVRNGNPLQYSCLGNPMETHTGIEQLHEQRRLEKSMW